MATPMRTRQEENTKAGGKATQRTRLVQVATVRKAVQRSRGKKTPPFLSHSCVHRVPSETIPGLTGVSLRPEVVQFIVPWQEIVAHMLEFYPKSYGPTYPWTMRQVICLVYTLQRTTWDFECLLVMPMALCLVPGRTGGSWRGGTYLFPTRESGYPVEGAMDAPLETQRELTHKFLAYDRAGGLVSGPYVKAVQALISLVPQSGLRLCREVGEEVVGPTTYASSFATVGYYAYDSSTGSLYGTSIDPGA